LAHSLRIVNAVSIVGILNVTPDSYFDGGKWNSLEMALKRVEEMITEGADWIEVGGESTGPNSPSISLQEEIDRTIPVIKEIRNRWGSVSISIDTYKSEVAREAIIAGATMVNDVTGGRGDEEMLARFARFTGCSKLVLMYAKDPTPRTTIIPVHYDDVIATIKNFLSERIDAAVAAGIFRDRIIIDPGLGHFVSSDPKYSFEIIARLEELLSLGCSIFLSPSRKSFLAGKENLPPEDRFPATIAASAIAVLHRASFIRTHDVRAVKRACEVAQMLLQ
jgi:dihydropteroate synthase